MKIVTSLSFQGQCRAAFELYASVLGGKITAEDWLMHCWLDVGDQALMGADMDVAWAPNIEKPKNGFDVTLHSKSMDEARRWFEQLSAGGRVVMPFDATSWSPGYGSVVDKFGVPWMVNVIPATDWKSPQT
jgi:PhnB protein